MSEHVLPLLVEAGIRWIASDEQILMHSLETSPIMEKAKWCATHLYTHYERLSSNKEISIVFRDHILSDLIGFSYSRVSPEDAADDLMKRLYEIDRRLKLENPSDQPALVSIILDGENAWEYYPKNGRAFLRSLYKRLSDDPVVETTTIGDYTGQYPGKFLPRLFAGSWINHNFSIWIGHTEDNKGWDFVKEARDLIDYAIVNEPQKKAEIEKAYEEIRASKWDPMRYEYAKR